MVMRAASGGHVRPDRREPPHVAAILARCVPQQAPDADVSDWHPNPALLMVGASFTILSSRQSALLKLVCPCRLSTQVIDEG